MKILEDIFEDTIVRQNLLSKKDKLILGVSGGPDSVCMLHQFSRIQKEYKLYFVCAHFNHGLRKDADKEENFIKSMCDKLKIKCISERKEVGKFFKGDSLEQTARNLRFDFFLKVSRQTKIKRLALAHHKDDLVETVLMRLIRGSGLKGLRGFLPKSKFRSLTVIRPMFELTKEEILSWLKNKNLSYCLDASNFEDKFFRNRIRLELIPFLKKLNPNIIDTLFAGAKNISLDYDFIHNLSQDAFFALKRKDGGSSLSLELAGLKKLPQALFNNVIRIAIEDFKGSTRRLEARHIEELKDLVFHRPSGSIVDLPQILVKKEENSLIIKYLAKN